MNALPTEDAYMLIGGNMGNRLSFLEKAVQYLAQQCGVIIAVSAIYETHAWGPVPQPNYLNQVVCLKTSLQHQELLTTILQIENTLGRKRLVRFGPRTIDIDILLYGTAIINKEGLIIPHPRLQERKFVLVPMVDVAANLVHPVIGKTMVELLNECTDELSVFKFDIENK